MLLVWIKRSVILHYSQRTRIRKVYVSLGSLSIENSTQIVCETPSIHIGCIPLHTHKDISVRIKNVSMSSISASISIRNIPSYTLKSSPQLTLQSSEQTNILLDYCAEKVGPEQGELIVQTEDQEFAIPLFGIGGCSCIKITQKQCFQPIGQNQYRNVYSLKNIGDLKSCIVLYPDLSY